jgi:hypothetical protein
VLFGLGDEAVEAGDGLAGDLAVEVFPELVLLAVDQGVQADLDVTCRPSTDEVDSLSRWDVREKLGRSRTRELENGCASGKWVQNPGVDGSMGAWREIRKHPSGPSNGPTSGSNGRAC